MNGFVLYMDPGVDQVDVAMRPRIYRQGSRADVPERRGSISLTFSGGGPAVTIRGHVSIFRPQPEGISEHFGYQEAVIIGLANAWSLMSRTVTNSLLRFVSLKPLITDRKSTRLNSSH